MMRSSIDLDIHHPKVSDLITASGLDWMETGETSEGWMNGDWRASEDWIGWLLEGHMRTGLNGDGMVTKVGDLMEDGWYSDEVFGWIWMD